MKKICILNGPNLNLLGKREPSIYGNQSFEAYFSHLKTLFTEVKLSYFQSNVEGEIINQLHKIDGLVDGILLNAGAYSHTSIAIADAVAAIECKVVEIHISQPKTREVERHFSLLEKACVGSISGFGLESYRLGINYFIQ